MTRFLHAFVKSCTVRSNRRQRRASVRPVMTLQPLEAREVPAANLLTALDTPFTEDFNGMGTTTALPAGFTASGATTVTVAQTATLTSSSQGASYSFRDGSNTSDRAVGYLNSGSYTSPRSTVLQFMNNTGTTITSLDIAFDYEKYRTGTRAFTYTFFHGPDANPTTSAAAGDHAYAGDASNAGVATPTTVSKTVTLTGLSIPNGSTYYLKWTLTGTGGSSNGQGIGIDNVAITAHGASSTAPTVTTPTQASITPSTATLGGNVTADGGATITERGIVVSPTASNANPQIGGTDVTKITATGTTGVFTVNAAGLTSSTGYTFRAYAINSVGTTYSDAATFTTGSVTAPTLSNPNATGVTNVGATLGATIDTDGGAAITERGFVVSLTSANANPTIGGPGVTLVVEGGTSAGAFSKLVSGLASSSGYSFKAYAINSAGTAYSNVAMFTTQATIAAPTVTDPSKTGISTTGATLGGTVASDGGATITERGVVYAPTATNSNPEIGGTGVIKVAATTNGAGLFTVDVSGLANATGYSFRAYAINSAGTSYSAIDTFATVSPPTVQNPTSASVTNTAATLGGDVTADGGVTITEIGVVYAETSVNAAPTIGGAGVVQVVGTGTTGVFTVNATGLNPSTAYTFAAYAINSAGTTYTTYGTFTTLAAPIVTIPYSGGTYSNNFDWLPSAPTGNIAPAPTTTTPGFFADAPFSVAGSGNHSAQGWQLLSTVGTPRYNVSSGSLNTGSAYSFGSDTDRALGSIGSGTGAMSYGATLTNTGTTTYTEFTLTFTEEQWRVGGSTNELVDFQYAIGSDANIGSGTFVDALNGAGDLTTIAGAATGNGNDPLNRAVRTLTVTGISWAPGQHLSLKWRDTDSGGSDDGLGIDDLSFSAAAPVGVPGTFSINTSFANIAESGGNAMVTITRAAGSTGAVDVNYTLSGTAAATDYTPDSTLTGTISFADGETSRTITITGIDDGDHEGDETLIVTLTTATGGATIGTPAAVTVTIVDDDPAQTQYFPLSGGNFTQDWTDIGLIAVNDNWSSVPSIRGFQSTLNAGSDPQTIAGASILLDVNANQTNPLTFLTGGVTEYELTDPTIALAGSNAALAPNLVAYLDTTGKSGIQVSYRLRDLETDPAGDNATQPVALQYRVGSIGDFINIPEAFTADATQLGAGPDVIVSVVLPTAADNQAKVELRWITVNATGNDEAVGIDDIVVGTGVTGPGVFSVSPSAGAIAENGGTANVQITRSGGSVGAVDVIYTISGTASAADYTSSPALTGTVSFADGETVKTIAITGVDDFDSEGDETLVLSLTAATGGGTLGSTVSSTLTIQDDDLPSSLYHTLASGSFSQDWTNTGLISANDDWSAVPSIRGYQTIAGATGSGGNPQSLLGVSQTLDVNANQTNPNTFLTGGVTEYEIADPVVSLAGSNSAVAPNLVAFLNTTGVTNIQVSYIARDLEDGTDDAVQPLALQYRIGTTGDFTDIPEAFIADATQGGVTGSISKSVTLPAALENQAKVELRWVTVNAAGNDEAVGIDNILITSGTGSTAGSLGFDPITSNPGEASGTVNLTVRRTGGASGAVSVNFAVTGGTATGGGTDYIITAGSLSWADNDTADKIIPITLINDMLAEGNETIIVTLSNPTGGATLTSGADAATLTIADNDALTAGDFTVNGGDPQRSRVTQVQLTFNGTVVLTPANFTLTHTTTNTLFPGTLAVAMQSVAGQTIATLTFSGAGTEFGSLADGRYSLAVTGVAGLTGPTSFAFHRLFGDVNGDATVDGGTDFAAFAIGNLTPSNAAFDFNGDGTIDGGTDFAEFGIRFGRTV